jgi:phosphatidate phosphatase PAH1
LQKFELSLRTEETSREENEMISFVMKAPKLFNEFLNSITIDEKNSKPNHYSQILELKRLQEVSSDLVLTLSSKIEYLHHKLKSVSSHVHQTSSQ